MNLAPGDRATYWHGRKGQRPVRVWVRVLAISEGQEYARVERPSGWWPEIITLPVGRLTKRESDGEDQK